MASDDAVIDTGFLGHPRGVAFLAMTEAWERFSFYGMRTLLILYMVQELLLPGRIEHVAGMAAYRSVVESVLGPMSTQAFASQTFGLYSGFVYFTPLLGGLLADRWLGAKKTVMIGIALMTAGHFAMVFDWSFLLALVLLVLGSGCLKGNIAAQVGRLYPRHDEARRTRGFTIFSTGINIGAVLGPLVCGLLAQLYGWHTGFGTAGIVMLMAAAFYFAGLRHFAEDRPPSEQAGLPALTGPEWRMIALIGMALAMTLFQFLAYDQMFNTGLIWLSGNVDLSTPLGRVPEAWFGAEDSFASVLVVPFLIGLWRWQAKRGVEPGDFGKIAIGSAIMAASAGAMAVGAWSARDGGASSMVWPGIAFGLSGIAFMWSWPTMLALVSRRAPRKVTGLLVACVYLTAFVTGIGSGYIARYYELLPNWQFWAMNAALSLTGMALVILLGPALKRGMDRLEVQMG